MYLINTETKQLQYFNDTEVPKYTILSHTWENEEITFKEIKKPTDEVRRKAGYAKIVCACRQSQKDGFEWIWIDTCCIDKKSSADLSEAINSMYRYYNESVICYVFLADVSPGADMDALLKSRWFTRGWTLQELIAPRELYFFLADWSWYTTRVRAASALEKYTWIPTEVLHGESPALFSVAQRMSWARNRETTRPEDRAYSLMGLFNINMPLLYGEGPKAFVRLQEEIIKVSADKSILAWSHDSTLADPMSYIAGVLAPSPSYFDRSQMTRRVMPPVAHTMTNLGLNIRLALQVSECGLFHFASAGSPGTSRDHLMVLKKLYNNQYVRLPYASVGKPVRMGGQWSSETVTIMQHLNPSVFNAPELARGILFSISRPQPRPLGSHVNVYCASSQDIIRDTLWANINPSFVKIPFPRPVRLKAAGPWAVIAIGGGGGQRDPTFLVLEFNVILDKPQSDKGDPWTRVGLKWYFHSEVQAMPEGAWRYDQRSARGTDVNYGALEVAPKTMSDEWTPQPVTPEPIKSGETRRLPLSKEWSSLEKVVCSEEEEWRGLWSDQRIRCYPDIIDNRLYLRAELRHATSF